MKRARCPVCKRRVSVNPKARALRKHRVVKARGAPSCLGSGQTLINQEGRTPNA